MRKLAALAAVLVVLLGACSQGAGDGGEPPDWPPDASQVIAWYEVGGGFVPYAWHLLEGPRLVVYGDGRAVAESRRSLVLSEAETRDLVRDLRAALAGLGPTASTGGETQVADAPTSVLKVRGADGTLHAVSAYALGIAEGYPQRLVGAADRMTDLAERVVAEGGPYTSDRVRLVAQPTEKPSGTVMAWPHAVPLPPGTGEASLRTAVLSGADAAAVAQHLPGERWRAGDWPVLRTDDGNFYAVAWRYLVPEEPDE